MTTFVVASKANQPYLSECQILGEHLMKNCPDVEVKFVIKDTSEWPQFIQSVCKSYGFVQKSSTVVYTLEGKLIGDGRNFIEYIREHFGANITISKEQQKNRTALNVKENEERMRKMKEGESLAERIELYMEKVKKKKVAQQIDDCFYEECIEKGIPFQVRRSNFLRDMTIDKTKKAGFEEEKEEEVPININKTMTVTDIELQRQIEMEQAAMAEAKRDPSYEEFEKKYGDHINGKIDPNTRVAGRPVTAGFDDPAAASRTGTGAGPRKSAKEDTQENMDGASSKKERSLSKDRSHASRSMKNASKMSSRSRMSGASQKTQDHKFDISKECILDLPKENKIETFDENYILAAHPFPQMEGELMLFQQNAKDLEESRDDDDEEEEQMEGTKDKTPPDFVAYRDYSLMKRWETSDKEMDLGRMTALEKKKYMENDQQLTRLQCLEVNNCNLFSTVDWAQMVNILQEVQGLGWIQILPVGQKSSTPFQFNMMHVLPSSKIPFSKVPLDVMISNKTNFSRKKDKRMKEGIDVKAVRAHKAIHKREDEAEDQDLMMLDELPFEHVVCPIDDGELNVDTLKYSFKKLAKFLKFDEDHDCGMTFIIAPQWMFLAPIFRPYHQETQLDIKGKDEEEGVPLYHDGFAYAGILNLQDTVQVWPETTGLGNKQHTIIESLTAQSKK